MLPTSPLSGSAGAAGSAGALSDARNLAALKGRAAHDPKSAIREAAKQFESMFMQELLKNMRQSSMVDGSMENEGSQLGRELLDGEWSQKLSGLPGGLSDAIAKQLERQMGIGGASQAASAAAAQASTPASALAARRGPAGPPSQSAADFITRHTEAARAAEAASGIPATFMIAQAAHESGWGKREIRHPDGRSANNLFGIKAGSKWEGPTVDVTTTEYLGGQPRKVVQRFRAYASAEESFADYARMMKTSSRYADVVNAGHDAQRFAQGLQRAGYATDPAYASKLGRMIQTTMNVQRSMAMDPPSA